MRVCWRYLQSLKQTGPSHKAPELHEDTSACTLDTPNTALNLCLEHKFQMLPEQLLFTFLLARSANLMCFIKTDLRRVVFLMEKKQKTPGPLVLFKRTEALWLRVLMEAKHKQMDPLVPLLRDIDQMRWSNIQRGTRRPAARRRSVTSRVLPEIDGWGGGAVFLRRLTLLYGIVALLGPQIAPCFCHLFL